MQCTGGVQAVNRQASVQWTREGLEWEGSGVHKAAIATID